MLLHGVDVRVSNYDGMPIKNKLPDDLRESFLTRRQWLAKGYVPSDWATAIAMHPNAMNKKLVEYFHEDDVTPLSRADVPRSCLTCKWRERSRLCYRAGGYVGERNCCSEWEPRF